MHTFDIRGHTYIMFTKAPVDGKAWRREGGWVEERTSCGTETLQGGRGVLEN